VGDDGMGLLKMTAWSFGENDEPRYYWDKRGLLPDPRLPVLPKPSHYHSVAVSGKACVGKIYQLEEIGYHQSNTAMVVAGENPMENPPFTEATGVPGDFAMSQLKPEERILDAGKSGFPDS